MRKITTEDRESANTALRILGNAIPVELRSESTDAAQEQLYRFINRDALPDRECIHPGVFARGPVPGTEFCPACRENIPRTEL